MENNSDNDTRRLEWVMSRIKKKSLPKLKPRKN